MPTNQSIISEWKSDLYSVDCRLLHTVPSCAFKIHTVFFLFILGSKQLYFHSLSWKHCLVEASSYCSLLVFRGTSQKGRTERTRTALQECGAIFRLFVLMLCHRPVHTQTHILSCSALTLSLVSGTVLRSGETMFYFLTQTLTIFRGCVSTIP